MLNQRLMPTTAASMVLVATDTAADSLATAADTLPHTPTATDTHPLTAMDLTGSTSVKLILNQRLMLTTAASMVLVLDTPLDTLDTPLDTHTLMAILVTHMLLPDTTTKLLKECTLSLLIARTLKRHSLSLSS